MTLILYIALAYLALTTGILLLNRNDFNPLLEGHKNIYPEDSPMVSICVPARNEESVIERCLKSALKQDYPKLEVLVLDDESTDRTPEILAGLSKSKGSRLRILRGKPKPQGWLGKPWACQQLAEQAQGDILIFIDADTWLQKTMVSRIVRSMGHDVVDFATVWPQQQLLSFWEKVVLPLVYYALLTLLPARYVHKTPKWIPSMLEPLVRPMFAAACGQCMAFKRSAYETVGGHASVKSEVVEDVALAKVIKKKGLSMKMYHGENAISCRMYNSGKEIREGFSKNFLAGFNHNIPLFLLMAVLHLIVFIVPFIVFPIAILQQAWWIAVLSALGVLVIILHRILLAQWFRWNKLYALLHPVGVLWFQKLGAELIVKYFKGEKSSWKGRSIS